jgi:STE24 endopeptidase
VNEDKSSRYHRQRRRVAVLSVLLTTTWLAALAATGASIRLREFTQAISGGAAEAASTVAVYVCLLAILQDALGLPLAWYRGFALEHRYGLSSESFRAWAWDYLKSALVALALGLIAVEVVYFSLRRWPDGWWIASAGAFIAGMLILARLAPVFLLPIFYRFKPLDREALRLRLLELFSRAGVPVLGVYEWGLGEKTRRANAALVGTGSTRRVLLSDTLLEDYTDDEIEVILAHELGHHAHHDIVKGLVLESLLLIAGFWLVDVVLASSWRPLGLTSPADVAGLPLLLLTGGAVSLAGAPIVNALSRRSERRADRYALAMTRRPAAFVSAMRRLAAQNLVEPAPSTPTVWLFHTHPPIEERIRAARAFE